MRKCRAVIVGVCSVGAALGAGCSQNPGFHVRAGASTETEEIMTDSTGSGRNCSAVVTVRETLNGRTHRVRRAGVPCGTLGTAEAQMVAAAKRGL